MAGLKAKLMLLNFLEFAAWGSWLVSFSAYLGGTLGFTALQTGSIYATMGLASLVTPALFGIIADKWVPDERLMSLSHFLSALFLLLAAQASAYGTLYLFVLLAVFFFMPTLGLTNAVSYNLLETEGLDRYRHFPSIRLFGTAGFVCAALFVDLAGLKESPAQLLIAASLSLLLALYLLSFKPSALLAKKSSPDAASPALSERLGLDALALLRDRQVLTFFLFSIFMGVCMQISDTFTNDFLSNHFGKLPEYAGTFGVERSGTLISLSQISETLSYLILPFFMLKFGVKGVLAISLAAWGIRFGLLGLGDPGSGVWLLVTAMAVYGFAFSFSSVAGSLYVDHKADPAIRSSAQGLLMMLTSGVGNFAGSYLGGFVIDAAGYPAAWFIFSGYAFLLLLLFLIFFKKEPLNTPATPQP